MLGTLEIQKLRPSTEEPLPRKEYNPLQKERYEVSL